MKRKNLWNRYIKGKKYTLIVMSVYLFAAMVILLLAWIRFQSQRLSDGEIHSAPSQIVR